MTIRNKLILGFSSLTGILIMLGFLAWLYFGWIGKDVNELVEWKIPAVRLAVNVHAGAYDATIEQLNYLLYEKPETHQQAKAILAKMDQDLNKLDLVAKQFNDQPLLKESKAVRANVKDFGLLYNRGVQALIDNSKAVNRMVTSGKSVLAEADAFALKQEEEYAKLRKINAPQEQLNTKVQKYILVNKIKLLAYTIIQHEKQERLYKDRNYYQIMLEEFPRLMALYEDLEILTVGVSELDNIANARSATDQYFQAAASWIKNDTALKDIVTRMNGIAEAARNSAENAENAGWKKAKEVGDNTVALVNQAEMIIIIAVLFGAIIGAGLSIVIPKNISSAINALSEFSKRFGQGDLTIRTRFEPSDEIGIMAQDFDKAAGNLQNIIQQVNGNARVLTEHSGELFKTVDKNTSSLQKQRQHTEQVATAMNEMASTVVEVAKNAMQAASAANDANTQSTEGHQVVSLAVASINSLSNEIDQASTVIQQLETDVGNIGAILDVIRSVSEQTNLLALNAAIEAARAGEHGRGFAVVADEVRTLASRTQASTDEIQSMIEKLQSGAKQAVGVMNTSHNMTKECVQQASESGVALEAITQSVSIISDMNAQIATAADQQTAVAEEINQGVVMINNIAEESVNIANETSTSSANLSDLANELSQAVSQFKV